jgi:heat shock protein HslJ
MLAELQGREWRLLTLRVAGDERPLPGEVSATLRLQDGNNVGGVAFVNRFFGTLDVGSDGALTWGQAFGSTRMAGPPELMELEQTYLDGLLRTERMSIETGQLLLESNDGSVRFRFQALEALSQ